MPFGQLRLLKNCHLFPHRTVLIEDGSNGNKTWNSFKKQRHIVCNCINEMHSPSYGITDNQELRGRKADAG